MADLTLEVSRHIKPDPARVFAAWTRPDLLVQWWGPAGVSCPEASVDLKVGGAYAIANQTPHGVVWIKGEFVEVEPPDRLVYTWGLGGVDAGTEERGRERASCVEAAGARRTTHAPSPPEIADSSQLSRRRRTTHAPSPPEIADSSGLRGGARTTHAPSPPAYPGPANAR